MIICDLCGRFWDVRTPCICGLDGAESEEAVLAGPPLPSEPIEHDLEGMNILLFLFLV